MDIGQESELLNKQTAVQMQGSRGWDHVHCCGQVLQQQSKTPQQNHHEPQTDQKTHTPVHLQTWYRNKALAFPISWLVRIWQEFTPVSNFPGHSTEQEYCSLVPDPRSQDPVRWMRQVQWYQRTDKHHTVFSRIPFFPSKSIQDRRCKVNVGTWLRSFAQAQASKSSTTS